MKVKILTECGNDIGYGHYIRCLSLYKELMDRNIDTEFIIAGIEPEINDVSITLSDWHDIDTLKTLITKTDYVIVDSYLASKTHYDIISNNSFFVMYIDDNKRIDYPEGIILNPALSTEIIDYSTLPCRYVCQGSRYIILREPFCKVFDRHIHDAIGNVLVLIGGSDNHTVLPIIVKEICKTYNEINFTFVCSERQRQMIDTYNEIPNIKILSDLTAEEMCNLMLKADMAISAAGQTVFELSITKTPFIAIQIADNQSNNLASIKKLISEKIVLESSNELFSAQIKQTFAYMFDLGFRVNISNKLSNLIDPYGTKRIIDIFLNIKNSDEEFLIRNAKPYDIYDVFNLSNKDYVRKYSINKDKIQWENHILWFNSAITDKNAVFHIVTEKNGDFIGQVRYNITENDATVSISLSESVIGKGLSKKILRKSLSCLFDERENIARVFAYVNKLNIPSKMLFQKMNFLLSEIEADMEIYFIERNTLNAN